MKRHSFLLVLAALVSFQTFAQSSLTVACWNIEWFGSTSNGPTDENLQESNVKKILRYLNADIYGLEEVVDTLRLRRVTDSLGAQYKFVIADFCSGNNTGTGNSWLTGQKEAFIYNKNIFTNVKVRGLMRSSATAVTNFASGRLPYLLNADVTVNGTTRNFNFIVIHGKSGSSQSDYDRRLDATKELKDTLDAFFQNQNTIIMGDYNDALNTTICTTCTSQLSSYDPLIRDSAHYKSITLPLAYAGQSTMINYPNVIDNQVISFQAFSYYTPGSIQIRTDVTNVVPDYLSGNTSDHYPVTSKYNFSTSTGLPSLNNQVITITAFPNPVKNSLSLSTGKALTNVRIALTNIQGQVLLFNYYNRLNAGSLLPLNVSALPSGIYLLQVRSSENTYIIKIIKS